MMTNRRTFTRSTLAAALAGPVFAGPLAAVVPGGTSPEERTHRYTVTLKSVDIRNNHEGFGRGRSGEFRVFTSEVREGNGRNVLTFSRKLRKRAYDFDYVMGEVWTSGPKLSLWIRYAEV